MDRGLSVLSESLALAEPQGYVRVFVDEGRPVADLLRIGVQSGVWHLPRQTAYVHRLLKALGTEAKDREQSAANLSPLVEPLTRRELEVLQCICAGSSNQEIAEKLVITQSTVKKHTGSIYGKLGVSSRTQAIVRAHQLRLVAPDP